MRSHRLHTTRTFTHLHILPNYYSHGISICSCQHLLSHISTASNEDPLQQSYFRHLLVALVYILFFFLNHYSLQKHYCRCDFGEPFIASSSSA